MTESRFPGRWLGGVTLILGPLFMLTGVLLRAGPHFFFPDQLEAYQQHPTRMFLAYSAVLLGTLLLWPAVVTLAQRVAATHRGWALAGGALVVFGLFGRAFHAGVDHLAFQLARIEGVASATSTISAAYGAYHVVSALNLAIMAGWIVLAVGAWRARVLGLPRAIALAAMSALPLGVLKGTTPLSVVAVTGLVVALLPLGIRVLRDGPRPSPRAVIGWALATTATLTTMAVLGTAG